MKLKKPVFSYLDMLFNGSEIIDQKDGIKCIDKNGNTIFEIVTKYYIRFNPHKPNDSSYKQKIINFDYTQFYFIREMFVMDEGDIVDLIKDYISTKLLPDIDLSFSPFYPHL